MDNYQLPQKLPFSKKRLPKKVIISYILDYVIIIVFAIAFNILDAVEPYHQHFSLRNYTLQYPYAVHERVPVPLVVLVAIVCPIVIIAIITLVIDGLFSHDKSIAPSNNGKRFLGGKYRFKDRLWEFNCGVLGLLLSEAAAFTITGALKNATGKPRPDLIDRCKPNVQTDPQPFGLSNITICTQTDHAILKDGFRSFPSGHSSSAFAGLFFLSLYLAGKLHVLDNRGEVWKTLIVLIPTLGAALIADSRIMDARHHPFDVITGSLIGIVVAWCAYRQYFPPLKESWRKGRAYPIRSWGREPVQPEDPNFASPPATRYDNVGVEPLRPAVTQPADEERPYTSSTAVPTITSDAPTEQNVFRQQIRDSQRKRNQAQLPAMAQRMPSSNYSQSVIARSNTEYSSVAGGGGTSRRNRFVSDDYSSSEDEEGSTNWEAYEMQQPQNPFAKYNIGSNPYDPRLSQVPEHDDTAYHSQSQAPIPPPHSSSAGAGLGATTVQVSSPPPPRLASPPSVLQAQSTAFSHPHPGPLDEADMADLSQAHHARTSSGDQHSRGVQLVETYAPR
ncbi:PAP2-domain-containing protein [Xylona heveae TC161]|uniref:PAP2-domain-containing protein n=1 Tax=Xylona heveae (strain CBS 132557 / TC161) TaxID=1328760 RepID=A0A165JD33_XYLHT|nr:PAP2-domain-containing protein [Xylona heveae TC161]KZF26075.1 PAP2-domain-containing protein [Xylona heveae TC161]